MMQLNTRHFGIIEIDETRIIDFPDGIPGFEDTKKYALISSEREDNPFQWLQGVDNPDLALALIDPRLFKPDYIVDVPDEEVAVLEITDVERVLVYTVVVVPEQLENITANLKAPILINAENHKGKQVIVDNSDYPIRCYFMSELDQKDTDSKVESNGRNESSGKMED